MIPWLIFAVVAVPLLVIGFVAMRRRTVAGERVGPEDAERRAQTEDEFAEAEAFEAEWRDGDAKRYRRERLP